LQRLKATALKLRLKTAVTVVGSNRTRLAKPRLVSAVEVESNRTSLRPVKSRLKNAVEAAESNRTVARDCAVENFPARRCGCLRILFKDLSTARQPYLFSTPSSTLQPSLEVSDTNAHPKNALRRRAGCREDRGLPATAPAGIRLVLRLQPASLKSFVHDPEL